MYSDINLRSKFVIEYSKNSNWMSDDGDYLFYEKDDQAIKQREYKIMFIFFFFHKN